MTNLSMRPTTIRDVRHIMTWVNDPEVVKNLQHFNTRFTVAHERAYVAAMRKSKRDFLFSFFAPDGAYVGQGGIHQISWENKLGRLSLVVVKEQWGKGYAQVIVPMLMHYAFARLKLHKVWLVAWATNKKNMHLYAKLRFKKEGVLKDEYFWQGKYHDMVRMRMLSSEFKKPR